MSGRVTNGTKTDPLVLRLRLFIGALALLVVGWSAAFMAVEGLGFADALYFTMVTITTVGYGDISPATGAGKMLAVLAVLTGTGLFGGMVASLTEVLLNRRERRLRMQKQQIVIGAFFAEVGTTLLTQFSGDDGRVGQIRGDLVVTGDWSDAEFEEVSARIRGYDYRVDGARIDFGRLRVFLSERRSFMLRLLENPSLVEHEQFTDLLLATFHLAEELTHRRDLAALPPTDLAHLAGDVTRVYGLLVHQWLDYLRYLKADYPYLFSLAIRTNPFDGQASPIVTG